MSTVAPSGADSAFEGILAAYGKQVSGQVKKDVSASGKVALSAVQEASNVLSGGYAAGWRMKPELQALGYYIRIYNATKPGLAHLLEFGHGGPSPAPAYPHIAGAYEAGRADLEGRMS